MLQKLAIIGASYLQVPLIEKAKSMGFETHVFAWKAGDRGEKIADYFYPISIREKDKILEKCKEIGISGICSIASDLAAVTVNYVAGNLGLVGNSMECTYRSTNKYAMRESFFANGDPSPASCVVLSPKDAEGMEFHYPVIVKPIDRSGSRGITQLTNCEGLREAVQIAIQESFEKKALIEEFAEGSEYSVECISWQGEHHLLAITKKYTTGAPHFVEIAHLQPAPLSTEMVNKVKIITFHALDSLGIQNSASHTELKIDTDGTIKLIEVGGRMGGDCIGSDLVYLTTGIDFVSAVIQIAVGIKPDLQQKKKTAVAGIRFIIEKNDFTVLDKIKRECPQYLVRENVQNHLNDIVMNSAERAGYFIFCAESQQELEKCLPQRECY